MNVVIEKKKFPGAWREKMCDTNRFARRAR
jgi:hypothetical protein